MRVNLLNSNEEIKEYIYYTANGTYLGQSEGTSPDPDLYNQAHYVFDEESEMVKNLDILGISRKRLAHLRKELISTPISDMIKILDVNQQIKTIEEKIEILERNAQLPKVS